MTTWNPNPAYRRVVEADKPAIYYPGVFRVERLGVGQWPKVKKK